MGLEWFRRPTHAPEHQEDDAADGNHAVKVARFTYDVSGGDSGAIATHGLGVVLPDNAIVLDGMVDVVTTFTSAGADAGTIGLTIPTDGTLVTAIAISNVANPWDAGLHDIIPVGTAATALKTTAARELSVVTAVQVITAGKLVGFVRYIVSA